MFAGLDCVVTDGEALVLTGANGAGKSSLLRLLAGLGRPAAGAVWWRGEAVATDLAAYASQLHYVGHTDALKPTLTVEENVAAFARGDAAVALEQIGLGALARFPAWVLSAGQRRRTALARLALTPRPLWLLDEPANGLDAAALDRLGVLIAAHRAGGGIVVAATHTPLPVPGARELRL